MNAIAKFHAPPSPCDLCPEIRRASEVYSRARTEAERARALRVLSLLKAVFGDGWNAGRTSL